jgi:hypothetical protein
LVDALIKAGLDLPSNVLDEQECVDAILALLKDREVLE